MLMHALPRRFLLKGRLAQCARTGLLHCHRFSCVDINNP